MWRYAWRETIRHKGRTIGNVAGYALAVALMVILVSVLSASNAAATEVFSSTGTHFIVFLPECTSDDCPADLIDPVNEGFTANGSPSKLIDIDLVEEVKALSTVADAAPALYFKMLDPSTGKTFTIIGLSVLDSAAVRTTTCAATDVVSGRYLLPDDKNLVMLEEAFAYARALPPGLPLDIAGQRFTVAGVINPGIRPAKADVYMKMDEALRVINSRLYTPVEAKMNIVLVESAGATVHKQTIADVRAVLGERSLISTYACSAPAASAMGINENGLKSITFIVAMAVVAMALKSQYSSVVERRFDIGIMKSIGWSNRRVAAQLFSESLVQGLFGAIVGVGLALTIVFFVPLEQITGIAAVADLTVPWAAVGWGFGLALLGGIIAGVLPGLAAARLKPADILRRL